MQAALKIAVDMAEEGLITREEAVLGVDGARLDQILHPTLDPETPRTIIATEPAEPRLEPPLASLCSTPTRPSISRPRATP